MPHKHRLNIDFAKITGAIWFTSPKGERCLAIVPSKSRMKRFATKKEGGVDSLYGDIEIVPLKAGPNDREQTHFIVESTTREERESAAPPQLPIIGMAREYVPYGQPASATSYPRVGATPEPEMTAAVEGDEIPF